MPSVGDGSPITGGAAAPSSSSLYNPFSVNTGGSSLWWQQPTSGLNPYLVGAVAFALGFALCKWKK